MRAFFFPNSLYLTSSVFYLHLPAPKGLQVTFHGGPYPETDPLPQSFTVSLLCETSDSDPEFVSYDGQEFKVEWRAGAGCEIAAGSPGSGDKEGDSGNEGHVGSGIGWFFFL